MPKFHYRVRLYPKADLSFLLISYNCVTNNFNYRKTKIVKNNLFFRFLRNSHEAILYYSYDCIFYLSNHQSSFAYIDKLMKLENTPSYIGLYRNDIY